MKRVLGERGNIVAFIVIAIIALVFVLLLSRHEPVQISKDINTESKVETITSENIRRASRMALQKFAKGGYSTDSSVWVCNAFMPPLANEVDCNFASLLSKDLNSIYFSKIKKELGYVYDENLSISLGLETQGGSLAEKAKMLSLPEDRVDVNVNFVRVSTEGQNEKRALDNSMFESYPYRKWLLYKNYMEWAETYLPILGKDVCIVLSSSGACTFSRCADRNISILIPDSVAKSYVKLGSITALPAVQKQLQFLNSIMNPDDFDCEVDNFTENVGVMIARIQKCDFCEPCFQAISMPLCGAWSGPSGFVCPNRAVLGPYIYPPGAPPQGEYLVPYCPPATNPPPEMMKHEAVTANAYVLFSFEFACTDRTKSISWSPSVEKSTAKISIVTGMARTCPLLYMCPPAVP